MKILSTKKFNTIRMNKNLMIEEKLLKEYISLLFEDANSFEQKREKAVVILDIAALIIMSGLFIASIMTTGGLAAVALTNLGFTAITTEHILFGIILALEFIKQEKNQISGEMEWSPNYDNIAWMVFSLGIGRLFKLIKSSKKARLEKFFEELTNSEKLTQKAVGIIGDVLINSKDFKKAFSNFKLNFFTELKAEEYSGQDLEYIQNYAEQLEMKTNNIYQTTKSLENKDMSEIKNIIINEDINIDENQKDISAFYENVYPKKSIDENKTKRFVNSLRAQIEANQRKKKDNQPTEKVQTKKDNNDNSSWWSWLKGGGQSSLRAKANSRRNR